MGESFVTYAHHWCSTKRTRQKDGFSAIRLHQSCGGLAMTGRCWASCSDHVECWVGIFIMTRNGWSSLSLWRESPRATRMGRMMEISRMSKSLKRRLGRLFSCEHCHVLFASILLIICFPSFLPAFFHFDLLWERCMFFSSDNPNLSRKLLDGLPGCPALSQSYQEYPYQVEGFVHSHCWLYWKHIVHAVQAGDLWNLVAYFFRLEACWIENGKMRKSLGTQQPVDFFGANGWSNTKLLRSWDVVCEIYGVASWCFEENSKQHTDDTKWVLWIWLLYSFDSFGFQVFIRGSKKIEHCTLGSVWKTSEVRRALLVGLCYKDALQLQGSWNDLADMQQWWLGKHELNGMEDCSLEQWDFVLVRWQG